MLGVGGSANLPVFATTGPGGHRGRMRARLLDRGAEGLADYEVLEMLLFVGIRRGDTKPLAKALINRFGSLAGVLSAPSSALRSASGELATLRAILPLRLPEAASERLARAEIQTRPVLGSLTALRTYLDGATDDARGDTRVLFLDNRNRLLADELSAVDEDASAASLRLVLRRALALHATALLLVDREDGANARSTLATSRGRATIALRDAAALLSVTVHDRILSFECGLRSYKAEGLLR